MVLTRSQSEFDQSTGIGSRFRLPSVISLVTLHCRLRGAIPGAGRLTLEIMFANQGGLNFAGAGGIDCLLAALLRDFLAAGDFALSCCGMRCVFGGCGRGGVRVGLLRGWGRRFGRSRCIGLRDRVHGKAEQGAEGQSPAIANLIRPVHDLNLRSFEPGGPLKGPFGSDDLRCR